MSVKVNNLLFRLITGSEGNRSFICIDDTTNKRIGSELLRNFILASPDAGGHFLALDNPIQNFHLDPSTDLKIHQCLGSTVDSSDVLPTIQSLPSGRQLFIDSLSPLFILHPEKSAQVLLDLKNKFSRVIALVSFGTLTTVDQAIVRDLVGTIVHLTTKGPNYEALILHRKPSTRFGSTLFKVKETFNIANSKFSYVRASDSEESIQTGNQTIEDLPFNLRSADEDNLVKRSGAALNIKPTGGGAVYYEPGKEDDVDEEDPDEDLLI